MAYSKCLSIAGIPELIKVKEEVSSVLVPGSTLSNKYVADAIRLFCARYDIRQDDIDTLVANSKQIKDFIIATFQTPETFKIERYEKGEYEEWYSGVADFINKAIDDTAENRERAASINKVTKTLSRVYSLDNGKIVISAPKPSYVKSLAEEISSDNTGDKKDSAAPKKTSKAAAEKSKPTVPSLSDIVRPARTLEYYVNAVENMIKEFSEFVKEGPDFIKNHKYLITDKRGDFSHAKEVDTTVTAIASNNKKFNLAENHPAASIGNTFDKLTRDFFDHINSNKPMPKEAPKNLDKKRYERLLKQLNGFKAKLDERFGAGGYRVFSNPFVLGGYYTDAEGNNVSIAGEPDLLVVDNDGNLHIYDMKAKKDPGDGAALSSSDMMQYARQLDMYRRLIETNAPEFRGKVKDMNLLLARVDYPKYAEGLYELGDVDKDGTRQVYLDGNPIQNEGEDTYSISLYEYNDKTTPYIIELNEDTSNLDNYKLEKITKADLDELGLNPNDPVVKELVAKGNKAVKNAGAKNESKGEEKEGEEGKTEEAPTTINLEISGVGKPITKSEIAKFAQTMTKNISRLIDFLYADPSRVETLFGSEPEVLKRYPAEYFKKTKRSEVLYGVEGKQLFDDLAGHLKRVVFDFGNDPELDYATRDKLKWLYVNFNAVLAEGRNTLIDIEGVSEPGTKARSIDLLDDEIDNANNQEAMEKDDVPAFAVESNTISVIGSMDLVLKRELSMIEELDEDGDPVYDDIGLNVYMNRQDVINYLMQNLRTSRRSSEMMERLDVLKEDAPWLNGLYAKAMGNSNFKAILFRTIRKAQNDYVKSTSTTITKTVETEDGPRRTSHKEYYYIPLAENTTKKATLNSLKANIINGKSEVFTNVEDTKIGKSVVNKDAIDEITGIIESYNTRNKSENRRKYRAQDIANSNVKDAMKILRMFGFDVETDRRTIRRKLSTKDGQYSVKRIISAASDFATKALNNEYLYENPIIPYAENDGNPVIYYLKRLNTELSANKTVTIESSGYDNHKTYQTFSNPSFISDLVDTIANGTNEDFESYVEQEIMPYGQMYLGLGDNNSTLKTIIQNVIGDDPGTFVSSWIRAMNDNRIKRKAFKRLTQTSFEGKAYSKLTDAEYTAALMIGYFTPTRTNGGQGLRNFRVPVYSDKNAFEFMQFYAYDGVDMKNKIIEDANVFFIAELRRMRSALEQLADGIPEKDIEFFHIKRTAKTKEIADRWADGEMTVEDLRYLHSLNNKKKTSNGIRFAYIPWFNSMLEGGSEGSELTDILNYLNTGNLEGVLSDSKWFSSKYTDAMDNAVSDFKKELINMGLLYSDEYLASYAEQNKGKTPKHQLERYLQAFDSIGTIDDAIEEYVWNDVLGTMNMFNLTMVDPTYAPNDVELQKRYSALHSSTEKCDVDAEFVDPADGQRKKYSDGTMRVIELNDTIVSSELAPELERILRGKVESASNGKEKRQYEMMLNTIPGWFKNFDMSDGQGFTSFTGFFKRYGMLGMMTPDIMEAFNRIRNGNYNIQDLDIVMQPIKPFVFTHIGKSGYGDTISTLKSPYMIKNSEYMVMLAGAIMQGADSKATLPTIIQFLEYTNHTGDGSVFINDGIDTVVFHSNVKLGSTGIIDISDAEDSKDLGHMLYNSVYNRDGYYNLDYVKEFKYSDWGVQQRVPAHMQSHEQGMSSQARCISGLSDIPADAVISVDGRELSRDEFIEEYANAINYDLKTGMDRVIKMLGINAETRYERNKILSEYLTREIKKDAKYNSTLLEAVQLVNGEFVNPLGDPAINSRIQDIIYSTVKNNVFKEKMPGGPVVQASCFGSDKLTVETVGSDAHRRIKYVHTYNTFPTAYAEELATTPDNGLMTMKELEARAAFAAKLKPYVYDAANDKIRTYKEIAELLKEAGDNLDEEIKERIILDKENWRLINLAEITRMLDYEMFNPENGAARYFKADRVPGEDKYSNLPCFVDEFLSRKGGECTMFPPELVVITNADFDIDKDFETWKTPRIYSKDAGGRSLNESEVNKNYIFDMQYALLTSEYSYDKILNPGNYEYLKDVAKMFRESAKTPSLMSPIGQIYFRRQNMLGKNMVAISALNGPSHTIGSVSDVRIKVPEFKIKVGNTVYNSQQFLNEEGYYQYDQMTSPFDGSRISKTIASLIGAAADTAKDPVLPLVNIVPATANHVFTMIRLGVPIDIIVGMLRQPIIDNIVKSSASSNEFTKSIEALTEQDISAAETVADTVFSIEDLKNGFDNGDVEMGYKAAAFLKVIGDMTDETRMLTDYTKLNSTGSSPKSNFQVLQKLASLAEFRNTVADEKFFDPNTIDKINNAVPYIKTLSDSYGNIARGTSSRFVEYSQDFFGIIHSLVQAGMSSIDMNEQFMKKLFNAFMVYRSTIGENALLDMSYQGRIDNMIGTPNELLRYDTNNEFIKALTYTPHLTKKVSIPGVVLNTGSMPVETIDILSASWNDLVNNSNIKTSEASAKLSDRLVKYNIYRTGFFFGPETFLNLATSDAKAHVKGYFDVMNPARRMFEEGGDNKEWHVNNFLMQFIMNNAESNDRNPLVYNVRNRDVVKEFKSHMDKVVGHEDSFVLDPTYANVFLEGKMAVNLGGEVYAKTVDGDGDTVLTKISQLGFGHQGLEYDANESFMEIKSIKNETISAYSFEDNSDSENDNDDPDDEAVGTGESDSSEMRAAAVAKLMESDEYQTIKSVKQYKNVLAGANADISKLKGVVKSILLRRNNDADVTDAAKELNRKINEIETKYCK